MRVTATIETDTQEKTITLSVEEDDGDAITTNGRTTRFTPEAKHHARRWIADQFEIALQLIDEN